MAQTDIILPTKVIEVIYTSSFEDDKIYREILQQSAVMCNTLSVDVGQIYPFVYSIASKYFPDLFTSAFATEQSTKTFEKLYRISLRELGIEYPNSMPITEILNAMLFDDFREAIKNAFVINPSATIEIFIRNMKPGGGKPQKELMTSVRNSCQCLVDNASLFKEIQEESLIFPMVDILRYNKDFRVDINISSTLPSQSQPISASQKQIISDETGSIIKICALYEKLGKEMDNFKNGIVHIFRRFGWLLLSIAKRNYLFDLLLKYNKINMACLTYIKNILDTNAPITTKKMCTDDTYIEECPCDDLLLCGTEKLCPESAKFSQVECKKMSGGVDYKRKYLKYKSKYIMLKK